MMKIGVVIPTFNRKKHLQALLGSLRNQRLEDGIELAVIVVVDGSTDGTIEMLQSDFPEVYQVHGTGNWWFTRSLNEGCRKACTLNVNYILTLNDDCVLQRDVVMQLVSAYHENPRCGAVGAITVIKTTKYRITFSGAKEFRKWRAKLVPYLDNRKEYDDIAQFTGTYPSYSLMTRGLLFSIKKGKEIGFFDDKNFPQYGSDDDFTLRLIKKGHPCYVSWDAKIFDDPLLTSVGSAITKPALGNFMKSFFNIYSVNSLKKTWTFQKKHGWLFLLPFSSVVNILGTLYAFFWKYNKSSVSGKPEK